VLAVQNKLDGVHKVLMFIFRGSVGVLRKKKLIRHGEKGIPEGFSYIARLIIMVVESGAKTGMKSASA
jgi:hypothetical protein